MMENLQELFTETIIEQVYLDPGYSGHGSDVWRVKTESREVVVRAFRWGAPGGAFWGGLHYLFGIDPSRIYDLAVTNAVVGRVSPIPLPQVLEKGMLGERPCIVVDYMQGCTLKEFCDLSEAGLTEFGCSLACIHAELLDYYGHPVGHVRYEVESFPQRLVETLRWLVENFYRDQSWAVEALGPMCEAVLKNIEVDACTYVLIDLLASQYLTDGKRITALVDTEAFVVAPREIDLMAVEYGLSREGAAAFKRGYEMIMPMPDLRRVRPMYRYFYRLLGVEGSVDFTECMNAPCVFDEL